MRIKGLISAPFTPMNDNGSLNLAQVTHYADYLKRNSSAGVFIGGTTGESMSLTTNERLELAKAWIQEKSNDFKVIVHVGHNCIEDAKILTRQAQEIKADAVGAMAPFFFKLSLNSLVDFCRELAGSAPDLPFYYYHIPGMTGAYFKMVDFLEIAGDKIPTLTGIKYTHEDLMDFNLCQYVDNGRFDMLFGRDEILLSGLAIGAQGGVGSSFNFAMPLYNRIIECFQTGNIEEARNGQLKSAQLIQVYQKYGGASAKAIMKLSGIDCGQCRKPLPTFSKEQYDNLQKSLEAIGFFDYCSK